MYEGVQKIPVLAVRWAGNALRYVKGNNIESVEHTGTGEYTITLAEDIDFNEVNIRVSLFGEPLVTD